MTEQTSKRKIHDGNHGEGTAEKVANILFYKLSILNISCNFGQCVLLTKKKKNNAFTPNVLPSNLNRV